VESNLKIDIKIRLFQTDFYLTVHDSTFAMRSYKVTPYPVGGKRQRS